MKYFPNNQTLHLITEYFRILDIIALPAALSIRGYDTLLCPLLDFQIIGAILVLNDLGPNFVPIMLL